MSEGRNGLGLVVMGVSTAVCVAVAHVSTEPLSPSATPLYAVPPLLLGLYLVVSATWIRDLGLYGALAGGLPELGHTLFRGVGFALVGLAIWLLLALPPAGAGAIHRGLPGLEDYCQGEPGPRLEREVLPLVESLLAKRAGQSASLTAALDEGIRKVMTRCGAQARQAFADARGTHSSWRRLREWLSEHPDLHGLSEDDPLWSLPFEERARERPSVAPVPVILEP